MPIWFGLFAPGATPKSVVERINGDVQKVILEPRFAHDEIISKGYETVFTHARGFFRKNSLRARRLSGRRAVGLIEQIRKAFFRKAPLFFADLREVYLKSTQKRKPLRYDSHLGLRW